jgi:hypothetical protein
MTLSCNRLIPTHGNWCGPGWSGGEWVDDPAQVDWSIPVTDAMDALAYDHDARTQAALSIIDPMYRRDAIIAADLQFAAGLKALAPDPRRWSRPVVGSWYKVQRAAIYRRAAIALFLLKIGAA